MLGLIFIYFLGKYFYELAERFEKGKWGFALLGIVVYYGSLMLFGFLAAIVIGLLDPVMLDEIPDVVFGLIGIPVGLLSAWLFYKYLEKKWDDEVTKNDVGVVN